MWISAPIPVSLSIRQVTTITDEDLQSAIENERYMMAEYNEITDRAAKDGDVVVIDFAGTVDGEELEDGSMEDMELELGSDSFIDGFEDEIVGMKAGETKTFDITFPEPYDGILDGQLATFEVTLNEIYEVVMPEYNDEYVASVSDCSTVEEYEAQLRTSLEEEYAADAMDMACEDLLISVIDSSTFSGRPEELYESCGPPWKPRKKQLWKTTASTISRKFTARITTRKPTFWKRC